MALSLLLNYLPDLIVAYSLLHNLLLSSKNKVIFKECKDDVLPFCWKWLFYFDKTVLVEELRNIRIKEADEIPLGPSPHRNK